MCSDRLAYVQAENRMHHMTISSLDHCSQIKLLGYPIELSHIYTVVGFFFLQTFATDVETPPPFQPICNCSLFESHLPLRMTCRGRKRGVSGIDVVITAKQRNSFLEGPSPSVHPIEQWCSTVLGEAENCLTPSGIESRSLGHLVRSLICIQNKFSDSS